MQYTRPRFGAGKQKDVYFLVTSAKQISSAGADGLACYNADTRDDDEMAANVELEPGDADVLAGVASTPFWFFFNSDFETMPLQLTSKLASPDDWDQVWTKLGNQATCEKLGLQVNKDLLGHPLMEPLLQELCCGAGTLQEIAELMAFHHQLVCLSLLETYMFVVISLCQGPLSLGCPALNVPQSQTT